MYKRTKNVLFLSSLIFLVVFGLLVLIIFTSLGKDGKDNTQKKETEEASSDTQGNDKDHEHEWGEGVVKDAAGCTTDGTMRYTCECGDTKQEVISATGHNLEKVEAVAPTKTTTGIKEHYVCDNCSKLFLDEAYLVDAGSGFSSEAYPFGNFSGTGYYIQSLGDNTVARLEAKEFWPTDIAISKEYDVADIPTGEYVMSFDVLLGSGVHADQWSMVVAMVSDGAEGVVDILNTKPDANSLGYNMLTNANSNTWTTYEIPFTTTGEYTTLKSVIYLWPEAYLNEPVYLDNFKIYKKDDASKTNIDTLSGDFENVVTLTEVEEDDLITHFDDASVNANGNSGSHEHAWDKGIVETAAGCTVNGIKLYTCGCGQTKTEAIDAIGHSMKKVEATAPTAEKDGVKEHYACSNCNKLFLDEAFLVDAATEFSTVAYPFGNFSGTGYYIQRLEDNKAAKLEATAYWPTDLAISKEYKAADIPAGEYVMSFDILLGSGVHADQWSLVVAMINDGQDGSVDILNTKPDANSLGYNMLTNANSKTWTTYEIPFTTTGEYTTLKSVIYLWPETYLNEPVYLDNFKIYKKGDTSKTNIDTLAGDFENIETYLEVTKEDITIPYEVHEHAWDDGAVDVAAGCTTDGTLLYTCGCGETKSEVISATGHNMILVEATEPVEGKDGMKEHYTCSNCDKRFLDEAFYVEAGSGISSVTYPFGNFSGTGYYIQSLGDNKVAKLESTAYWPTDLAITKEYDVADIPAGEYVMAFDVLLDSDIHGDQWSLVVAMTNDGPDGRKDILNTKPDANSLGYNMLTNANSMTWTTYEIPFTTTGEYSALKAEIYLWPEAYLNEPVYLDNFRIYKKDDASKTNIDTLNGDFEHVETWQEVTEEDLKLHLYDEGTVTKEPACNEEGTMSFICIGCGITKEESIAKIAHQEAEYIPSDGTKEGHYECKTCHTTLIYDEEKVIVLTKNTVMAPYANYGDNSFTIEVINGNAVGSLTVVDGWPSTTSFTKTIGIEKLRQGTYVLSFDVLLGADEIVDGYSIVAAMNVNGVSTDILNTKPDANSLGLDMLHNASHETWTTYEAEFVIPENVESVSVTLYLWSEVRNGGEIFVDNIKAYAKDDTTKTNLDTLSGDFEGYPAFKEAE